MSTLLDVLRLEIEMQAGRFIQGQKELQDSFDKLNKHLLDQGKKVENQHRATADSVSSVSRELQGMFGLLKGGLAAEALNFLKDFTSNISAATAGLGRLATNVGAQPQELNAWGLAVERIGGNAQAAMSYISGLSNKLAAMQRGHMLPKEYQDLSSMGGVVLDYRASPMEFFQAVIKNMQNVAANPQWGRRQAVSIGNDLGIDEGSINLILKGGAAANEALSAVKSLVAKPEDFAAAERLQASWEELRQTMEALNRDATTLAEGPLDRILGALSDAGRMLRGDKTADIIRDRYKRLGIPYPGEQAVEENFNKGFGLWDKLKSAWGATDPRRKQLMSAAIGQLREEGVPEERLQAAAAHLVGQAEAESSLNPNVSHDSGTGFGLYGARGIRMRQMFAWLAEHGYALNSEEGQMRYMAHEAMKGRYPATRNVLANADPSRFASDSRKITADFERPAIINDRTMAVQRAYASYGAGLAAAQNSWSTSTVTNSSDMRIGAVNMYGVQDVSGFSAELQAQANRVGFAFNAQSGAN